MNFGLAKIRALAKEAGLPYHQVFQMVQSQGSRRRLTLWAQDRFCWWCNTETTLALGAAERPVCTSVTVDHIKSRTMGRTPGERTRTVTACHRCNALRNKVAMRMKGGEKIPESYAMIFTRNWPPEMPLALCPWIEAKDPDSDLLSLPPLDKQLLA